MPRNTELAIVLALAAFGCAGTAQKEPEYPQQERSFAPDTDVSPLPLESSSAAQSTAGVSDLAESPPATLGEPQKQLTQPGSEPSSQTTQVMCPMSVQGAAVTRADIAGGVRLDFKAPAARLEELRSRVHYLSNIYSGPLGLYENQAITNLRYTVVSDDSAEGASITFRAQEESALGALRAQVQRHAAAMQSSGACLSSRTQNVRARREQASGSSGRSAQIAFVVPRVWTGTRRGPHWRAWS